MKLGTSSVRRINPLITVLIVGIVLLGLIAVFAVRMVLTVERVQYHVAAPMGHLPPSAPVSSAGNGGTPSRVTAGKSNLPQAGSVIKADQTWTDRVAGETGIPARALMAYASAELIMRAEKPHCKLGWNTIAAIGSIESDHGRFNGATVGADGRVTPAIYGIPLDGTQSEAIRDTDGGVLDGDRKWDRAMGPMQFIPETWRKWGADANGDGVADPQNIDDAALATGRYLCASSNMHNPAHWRKAVFAYNHIDSYVDQVATVATQYAKAGK